jgi:hypothetical protein
MLIGIVGIAIILLQLFNEARKIIEAVPGHYIMGEFLDIAFIISSLLSGWRYSGSE